MKTEAIKIQCTDGAILTGTLFTPPQLKTAVMIAPATGIKRTFYHAFAIYLAKNNFGVICYDNRGIGDSIDGPVKTSKASLTDWGTLDMKAVLKELKHRFPGTSYHLIGHSAGGQLAGLMDNAQDLSSMFNFACSSGSLRNMDFPFNIKAHFFMNFAIPVSNFLFGYTKSQWLGMGEPLPKLAASQWRQWCNGQGYVKVALEKSNRYHLFDTLSIPSLWLHASDDKIANKKNVKDMIQVYSKIRAEIITLSPSDWGYKDIGHMKFFSSKRKALWGLAVNWLNLNH